jgi:predicted DNA-binding transcriptional regulator AlpA
MPTSAQIADRPDFVSPKEAAAMIGKTWKWLAEMRSRKADKKGLAPPFYKIGGRILYVRSEVRAWRERQRNRRN